jgi:hypothetical protein
LIGRRIKVLRSDNGEYTSRDFSDFCIEAGIKREYTVSYNPQQNGVAERKNKTIIEATKAMIHDQNLPMILWAEESMTTVYVQNRSPHQILKNMTPEEAFTGVKLEVGHFRIFGCPVYFHVPKETRTKLDPSGIKGTFVGYNESSKEYRIYIPGQRQIEVSRDVTFEEEIAFRRSKESQMEINSEENEETIPSPPSTIQREIYKIKHAADGSVEKYRARFVARRFSQVEGIDYEETFAPVAQIHFHPYDYCPSCIHGLETTSDGCKDNLSQW